MSTKTGIAPIGSETQSLVDRVSHAVRRGILEGRLRPGEMLSISDLAADLRVSPSPVREALQRLSGEGLVTLRPARTAIVAALDLEDLREIYRLRGLIEVDAVGKAAPKLTEADLETLQREFDVMEAAPHDSEQFWTTHKAFHLALMAPVLTPRLERITSDLWQASERYIRIVYVETDALFDRSPHERHRPLLEAAQSRKPAAMRKALTDHLQRNEQEIASSLETTLFAAQATGRQAGGR